MLHNKVSQLYIYIHSLTLEPPLPTTPSQDSKLAVVTEHHAEFPMLHNSFQLAIYFTHGGMYTSMLLSQFVPLLLPPIKPREIQHFQFTHDQLPFGKEHKGCIPKGFCHFISNL